MTSEKGYMERTMSEPTQKDKWTFSAWFKKKPKQPLKEWVHVPIQISDDPHSINYVVSYTEEIDGVLFMTTTNTDGNGKLIEKRSIRLDRCRG